MPQGGCLTGGDVLICLRPELKRFYTRKQLEVRFKILADRLVKAGQALRLNEQLNQP